VLAVVDGNPGLAAALKVQWPQIAIQRCTNHSVPGRAHSKEVSAARAPRITAAAIPAITPRRMSAVGPSWRGRLLCHVVFNACDFLRRLRKIAMKAGFRRISMHSDSARRAGHRHLSIFPKD
jgi:hypothetical protein